MIRSDRSLRRRRNLWRVLLPAGLAPLLLAASALAGPYGQSAHGDTLSGVRRELPGPYVTGNCAHCHEQHGTIDGREPQPVNGSPSSFALFAPGFNSGRTAKPYQPGDVFCFSCHSEVSSVQAGGMLLNYDYAQTFGGYSGGPASILNAFNQPLAGLDASYHNLFDIWRYAQRFSGFGPDSSPCSACHNPHRARRNAAYPQDPAYTAISRPVDRESLWGDAGDERMSTYVGRYQAPFYYGSKATYEPGGVGEALADGSRVPDYTVFCLDCHKERIYSTALGRDISAIEWKISGGDLPGSGDKHGENAYTAMVSLRQPYAEVLMPAGGYVLSCLDCHEAHGAPNASLLRRAVNGEALGGTVSKLRDSKSLGLLCQRCHLDDYQAGGRVDSSQSNRWAAVHHGGGSGSGSDPPYPHGSADCAVCHQLSPSPEPIGCGYCHGHGTVCDSSRPGTLPNGKTIPAPAGGSRRTF